MTARYWVYSAVCVCLATFRGGSASAVVTSSWVVDSYDEFDAGEAESAFITSLGEVKPGWAVQEIALELGGVWASATAADGTVFVGSDDGGAIYVVRGDKSSKLTKIDGAIAVVSLALASDGTLYAGTMPSGQVWKVDSRSGKASKLAALPGVETVWSLAIAAGGTALYAGTGPDGKLFRIDRKSGAAKAVFDTEDKRVLSMVATKDGAIWFGTSDKAFVFRHDPKAGTTRAMADFAGNEVTALAEGSGGGVIAAANELKEPSTSGAKTKSAIEAAAKKEKPGQDAAKPKEGAKPGADKATPAGTEPPRKGGREGTGSLFRVRGDGRLEQLHALTQTYFTTVAVTDDGRVFAGAADKGRIYLIDLDDSVSTAFDVEQRMISKLFYDRTRGVSFTTSDSGALYRSKGQSRKSIYTSKVFDAKTPARFGKILWHADGNLKVETRSGNTGTPGKGWSRWQAPRDVARGKGLSSRGQVLSPPGRYIQYRVSFNGGFDDALRKTAVYYLPQNKATRITDITVGEPIARGSLTTLGDGATKPKSPIVKLKWTVDNDDSDDTEYSLAVRREGDAQWRKVATGEEPLTKPNFDWNTETFPDGVYRLRVTANDRRANTSDRALESHRTTALFPIDNRKPTIDAVTVRFPQASARASDTLSVIAEMAYSVDDQPWRVGSSQDGLFDDQTEMLSISLPRNLEPGVHTLSIRVADESGNIGSASVSFRVK